ncbi:E3 ubiquitin-protein ligase RING1-like [Nymphaea thermarum]|nr:E3 ubiquitin-protein ligase RING1-like [Nymphaea thermarum]
MAEFTDLRRLHRRVDEHQEEEEGEETPDFSLPFTFSGYDHAIHPSGADEHGSLGGSVQELDESLTPAPSSGRGYPMEDTEQRYLDQVDLVLDLFDHFSNAQLNSPDNSSMDGRSAVDFGGHEGEDELGSDYLGLGFGFRLGLMFGFDTGDWRRFSEQEYQGREYQENDGLGVVCDDGRCHDHSIDDDSIVDEGLGDLHPIGFTTSMQSFSAGGSVIECGDQSVVLGVEARAVGAISSIFGVESSDVVAVDGVCENGDFHGPVDGFGVVGLETESDEEEDVDLHDGACRVPGLGAISDVDNRSESDALSTDLGIPLCWDCLHLDDRRDSNEDFEWEEVNGGIDESEVLSQADSVYVERMVVDTVEDRMVPSEMWELHEPNIVETTNVEVHSEVGAGDVEDAAEAMENLDWAVLLTVNNLDTNHPDHGEQNGEFYAGDPDDFVYTAEYEILLGQFVDTDSLPKGVPPASKAFVDSLPSVLLTQEDLDSSRNLCAVCKDDISKDELVKRLPCSHFYHDDCILPWLNLRNTCPVCRYQLPTDDPEYERWRTQTRL